MMAERYKLLIEGIDASNIESLVEGTGSIADKTYKIRGVFMEAETKNRNGRIYPKPIMEREVKRYSTEEIAEGRAVSSLDHPPNPTVMLSDASHLITDLYMEGNLVKGEAKVLSTDKGRTLKCLINDGVKYGLSSRALGSLNNGYVGENFKLLGIDVVQSASAPAASIAESIVENFDYIISGSQIVAIAVDKLKDDLAKHGTRSLAKDLERFISKLSNKL